MFPLFDPKNNVARLEEDATYVPLGMKQIAPGLYVSPADRVADYRASVERLEAIANAPRLSKWRIGVEFAAYLVGGVFMLLGMFATVLMMLRRFLG